MKEEDIIEILLVEDREEDAELTMMGLESVANRIKWVKDGREALDFLFGVGKYQGIPNSRRLKLVLLDINLPKLNGLEVLKEIRGNPVTKSIPVTVLTTSKDQKDIYEAYDLGVNSYVTKPVSFSDFSDIVKSIGLYWLVVNRPDRDLDSLN